MSKLEKMEDDSEKSESDDMLQVKSWVVLFYVQFYFIFIKWTIFRTSLFNLVSVTPAKNLA